MKDMKETIIKAVTDAFIELKLGDIIERLDRRVSTLADRVATLETRQPTYEDTGHPEDEVYDAHGNIDHVATGQVHPDDPYAKIKFTIPSFSRHYDAEGYLDWEMTVEQNLGPTLFLSNIELDKPLVNLKTLQSFGGLVWLQMALHLVHGRNLRLLCVIDLFHHLILETCVRN
jgi:hypothetical protein